LGPRGKLVAVSRKRECPEGPSTDSPRCADPRYQKDKKNLSPSSVLSTGPACNSFLWGGRFRRMSKSISKTKLWRNGGREGTREKTTAAGKSNLVQPCKPVSRLYDQNPKKGCLSKPDAPAVQADGVDTVSGHPAGLFNLVPSFASTAKNLLVTKRTAYGQGQARSRVLDRQSLSARALVLKRSRQRRPKTLPT